PRRLRRCARGRPPRGDEPFAPLLGTARVAPPRLARSARAPRARRRHPSRPERHPMRILHTMLRVGNMERSVKFYTQILGMKLLRTTERPEQKYSLAFVGYDDEKRSAVLELTYNYGVERYELGSALRNCLRRAENARRRSSSSIASIASSGRRRTTADSTLGGGRNAPFDTVNNFCMAKRACNATERRPYSAVPDAATMRSTTSSWSMKCMSRTRSAYAAR